MRSLVFFDDCSYKSGAYVKSEAVQLSPKDLSDFPGEMATEVGARLATVRGSERQRDCAESLGVHMNTWGRYERGERLPDAEVLQALMRRGIRMEWLLAGKGAMTVAAQAPPSAVSSERLAQAIETLEEVLDMTGRTATPTAKADLVVSIYELFGSEPAGAARTHTAQVLRLVSTNTLAK